MKFMAELELMKERFAKLLLGEDMSGSGKGVCTAVTISNSITNLYGKLNLLLRFSKYDYFRLLLFQSHISFCIQLLFLDKI